MRTVSAVILAAIFLAVPRPSISQEPRRVDCHKDLKKAYEFLDNAWSFEIFKPGYVDLEREYRRLEQRAKNTNRPEVCADVIAQFMATLGDGHSSLQYYPGVGYTTPDIELRTMRERLSRTPGTQPTPHVYVVSRDTTDETLAEILPGSEIVSVDGEPLADLHSFWIDRVSGSTQQWKDYICDERLLLGPADSTIALEVRAPSGKMKTVAVTRPPYLSDDERDRERELYEDTATIAWSETLEGGWGYVRLTTFSHINMDTTVKRFDRALGSVMNAPGLIIDLRGNGGGILGAFMQTAGRFLAQEEILAYVQERQPGQEGVYEFLDPKTGDVVMKMPIRAEPREPVYGGPLVILIDRACFSACESFAGGLQGVDRALVVGSEASGGGSGWVTGWRLPSRAIISFSWTVMWLPTGQQVEGNGVHPDVLVRVRSRDLASGRDRVLERAIKALENGEARPLVVADAENES